MFMRPVKSSGQQRRKAAALKYEPVWVTCDDLASEGILVRSSGFRIRDHAGLSAFLQACVLLKPSLYRRHLCMSIFWWHASCQCT